MVTFNKDEVLVTSIIGVKRAAMARVNKVVAIAGDKKSRDIARRDVFNRGDVFEVEVSLSKD